MGVVWKAVDTTLDREVAIKVLPDAFAGDAERLARFEREAKLLASLNHANIAGIYGTARSSMDGVRFWRWSWSRRGSGAAAGPRSAAVDDALDVAADRRGARGRARAGRDPPRPQTGQHQADARRQDQGARLRAGQGAGLRRTSRRRRASMSPTMTSAGTVAGMILGTAAYMSPEQAKAKTVDRRADIWAFGVVLWEMLSGRKRLFNGDSVSETLAGVLMASDVEPRRVAGQHARRACGA